MIFNRYYSEYAQPCVSTAVVKALSDTLSLVGKHHFSAVVVMVGVRCLTQNKYKALKATS